MSYIIGPSRATAQLPFAHLTRPEIRLSIVIQGSFTI